MAQNDLWIVKLLDFVEVTYLLLGSDREPRVENRSHEAKTTLQLIRRNFRAIRNAIDADPHLREQVQRLRTNRSSGRADGADGIAGLVDDPRAAEAGNKTAESASNPPVSSLPDGSANAPATRASQTGPSAPGQLAVQHRQAPSGVGFLGNNMYNISRTYNTTAPFATDPYMTPYRPVGLYAVHPSAGYQSPVLFAPMLYNAGPLDYGPPVEFEQRMAYVRPQGQIQPRWLPPVPVAPYPAAAPSTIREPHFPMQQCTVPAFADPPAPREPYTPVQQRAAPAVAPAVAPVVAPVVAADPPDVGKAGTSKQKRSVSAVADPPYAPKQKRVTFAWTDVDRHGMPMEQRTVSEPVSADPPEVEEQPIEQLADPVVDDPLDVGQHDMPNQQRADAAVTDPMHAGGQFVECGVEAAQEIKQENVITRHKSAMPRRDSQ